MKNGKDDPALIDRLEYFMQYPGGDGLWHMFSVEERMILETIDQLEQIKSMGEQEKIREATAKDNDITEMIFRQREQEKDISFRLKEQITDQIDRLLVTGKAEAWLDILTWHQFLKGKCLLVDKFWEFPVLDTMLQAFQEEWRLHHSGGNHISVLSLRTMKELTDRYFTVVFMLRRIEHDVEPKNELLYDLLEGKVSLAVIETILENARIFDKEKVKKVIDGWNGN